MERNKETKMEGRIKDLNVRESWYEKKRKQRVGIDEQKEKWEEEWKRVRVKKSKDWKKEALGKKWSKLSLVHWLAILAILLQCQCSWQTSPALKKPGSVLGTSLEPLELVVERGMFHKLLNTMDNTLRVFGKGHRKQFLESYVKILERYTAT